MVKHLNITISGRVQGVGFRFSARNAANLYGIKGNIKNLVNGDVYIEAEGNEDQLNQFIKWCYDGPKYAFIENLNIEEDRIKKFKFFDILH
jgi:acylphosphatase